MFHIFTLTNAYKLIMPYPVILIASASPVKDLHHLKPEIERIDDTLLINHNINFTREILPEANSDKLIALLSKHKEQLAIFHFAGHANEEGVYLEDYFLQSKNISDIFPRNKNLKLVILNACATAKHIEEFFELGVEAVIATNEMISDKLAMEFSNLFYKGLFKWGKSLEDAFNAAKASLENKSIAKLKTGNPDVFANTRRFGIKNREEVSSEFPWSLYVKDKEDAPILNSNLIDILRPPKTLILESEEEIKSHLDSHIPKIIVASTSKVNIKAIVEKDEKLKVLEPKERELLLGAYGKKLKNWQPYLIDRSSIAHIVEEFSTYRRIPRNMNMDIWLCTPSILKSKLWEQIEVQDIVESSIVIIDCLALYNIEENEGFAKLVNYYLTGGCVIPICSHHSDFTKQVIESIKKRLFLSLIDYKKDKRDARHYNIDLDVQNKDKLIEKMMYIADNVWFRNIVYKIRQKKYIVEKELYA